MNTKTDQRNYANRKMNRSADTVYLKFHVAIENRLIYEIYEHKH